MNRVLPLRYSDTEFIDSFPEHPGPGLDAAAGNTAGDRSPTASMHRRDYADALSPASLPGAGGWRRRADKGLSA